MEAPTGSLTAGSYEDIMVSPTPGSPLHQQQQQQQPEEKMPDCKITLQVEIGFKGNWTKKAVRILPSASIHILLDKLSRKKYLPSLSQLGGVPLRSEQLDISHSAKDANLVPIERSKWSEPVWHVGLRDKQAFVVKIEDMAQVKAREQETSQQLIPLSPTVEPKPEDKVSGATATVPRIAVKSPEEERKRSILGRLSLSSSSKRSSSNIMAISQKMAEADMADAAPAAPSNIGLLFGIPLERIADKGAPLIESYGIPAFFGAILEFIKGKHTGTEGIFRLSGSLSAIREMKKRVDLGQAPPFPDDTDVHCLTSLLKQYLRELPEPLLTFSLFPAWRAAVNCDIGEKRQELLRSVLAALPKANYCLLKRLMDFLALMCDHEETTRMGVVNLATILGPNLIWTPHRDLQGGAGGTDISTPTQLAFQLITNAKELFPSPEERTTKLLALGHARYAFVPETSDELGAGEGEPLWVTANDDGHGWLQVTTAANPKHGKFPTSYFEALATFAGYESDPVLSISLPGSPELFVEEHERGMRILKDRLEGELEALRVRLDEEVVQRQALEEATAVLQDNFNTLLQVVLKMKERQASMDERLTAATKADVSTADPFADATDSQSETFQDAVHE